MISIVQTGEIPPEWRAHTLGQMAGIEERMIKGEITPVEAIKAVAKLEGITLCTMKPCQFCHMPTLTKDLEAHLTTCATCQANLN